LTTTLPYGARTFLGEIGKYRLDAVARSARPPHCESYAGRSMASLPGRVPQSHVILRSEQGLRYTP